MFTNVETYLAERISEVIAGESEPIVVRLLGPDLETLRDKAQEVKRMLGKIKGVDEVNVELQTVVPAGRGRRRPGQGRGVRASSPVTSAAPPPPSWPARRSATSSADDKTYDVQVWSIPSARASVDDIRNVLVDTPKGPMRLGDVATVTVRPTPNFIKHENGVRRLDVGAEREGPRPRGRVPRTSRRG